MRLKARHRHVDTLPEPLMKEVRRSRALIAKELPQLVKKGQRLHDAAQERTTSGELRRAIHSSRFLFPDLARRAETDMDTLDAFLTGEGTLTSDIIDRLTKILKLRLRPVNGKPKSRKRAG